MCSSTGRERDHDCNGLTTILAGTSCEAHVSPWDSFPEAEFLLGVDGILRGLKVLLLLYCHLQN